MLSRSTKSVIVCVPVLLSSGCASLRHQETASDPPTAPQVSQIAVEHGRPNRLVDSVGWVMGIPEKIILWDSRAKNHQVSEDTVDQVATYMHVNGLNDTMLRVNQYDPVDQWRRLASNRNVGAGWRYSVGAVQTFGETLFPGRLFGRDSYNPYTDTIHLYSDIPALALEQAAYAKDVHNRELPGTYAAVQEIPGVNLWHEKINKEDVQSYLATVGTEQQQSQADRILYPQYGSEVGEAASQYVPGSQPALRLVGAAVGHAAAEVRRIGTTEPQ